MHSTCQTPEGGVRPTVAQVEQEIAALHERARPDLSRNDPTPGSRALELLQRAHGDEGNQ